MKCFLPQTWFQCQLKLFRHVRTNNSLTPLWYQDSRQTREFLANTILSNFLCIDEKFDSNNLEHQRYVTQISSDQQSIFTWTFASVIFKLLHRVVFRHRMIVTERASYVSDSYQNVFSSPSLSAGFSACNSQKSFFLTFLISVWCATWKSNLCVSWTALDSLMTY